MLCYDYCYFCTNTMSTALQPGYGIGGNSRNYHCVVFTRLGKKIDNIDKLSLFKQSELNHKAQNLST